ncbi:B-cell receptor CD22-like [Periophthalmus magnuspinnatus]|uniref:B-cell receptor CD22-like n=1 Tax=Periophthalmus magnuspinnatus TaxID=409849 RepID=UPI002436D56C|nr:B-cell receptor CD22-like [Periophthalmus magnuspinnatus]
MAAKFVKMETHIFLILLLCSGALGCGFSRDLIISVPNLTALSGSCLWIPCTFSIPNQHKDKIDLTKRVTAIWSKKYPNLGRPEDPTFFNSAMPSPTSPIKLTGNLQQKNCTIQFFDINTNHSDEYFLRIENHDFKATALCEKLQINVQESPWIPSVQVSGSQREQETVTITCSAPSPCPHSPPELTWSFRPELPHSMLQSSDGTFSTSAQDMVQNSDGTFNTSVQLQMRLSEKHHGLEVRCSAVYPVKEGRKTAQMKISLSVEYSPKNTSVWLSTNTSLSVGQSVNLTCSSRAWPPVQSFSWFRVTSQGPQRVYEGQVYSLIFNHTTQGEYFCQAQNKIGKHNSSSINLHNTPEFDELPWKPILGGGIALLILICITVFISCHISKSRAPKEAHTETHEEVRKEEDTVLYGEVVFSKSTTSKPGPPAQHAEDPEIIYSQIRVSKAAGSTAQPTEDLYAMVKKS